jgi:hypothetical protein
MSFVAFLFVLLRSTKDRRTTAMADQRPTYIVHLRPEPDCTDSIKALGELLKRALRNWGLRCVGLSSTGKDAAP